MEKAASRAYLDHNASAPLLPAARQAMLDALDLTANPSSVHSEGRAARKIIEQARRDIAALVGTRHDHVVFTSGATEAASTLLTPDWQMGRAALRMSQLYVCEADHPCLLSGGRFPVSQVTRFGVDGNGILDLEALTQALDRHDKAEGLPLVAIHAANNETGVIQPLAAIGAAVKAAGGVLIADAAQAAGRIVLDLADGGIDFLILSAHKMGGPKGIGAFVGASDLMMPRPLVTGGGQERGFRAGTENLAAIAGFGAAAKESAVQLGQVEQLRTLRDRLEDAVLALAPDATIFGRQVERLANTTFFAIPGVKSETAQIAFDLAGVSLSAGSACSSGKVGPSHVLKAMGYDNADGALRVSIGRMTTEADLALFKAALSSILARSAERTKAACAA
ncbi:cysteine desulfurase [Pseudaminobacter arsenicus]|uniref:Cysteine desulfurase n=1 Tax=Borborobacter arsenicus TaxID=1851146 RepID=A0A432V794_9HYPH|nr:cysteine desulfurase family protein [Pseudaminobacter arsenicus]RUM98032.1 cysteine desulfurase [Pseudaminobacter arsenicus]